MAGSLHAAIGHLHLEPGRCTVVDLSPDLAQGDKVTLAAVNMTDSASVQLADT